MSGICVVAEQLRRIIDVFERCNVYYKSKYICRFPNSSVYSTIVTKLLHSRSCMQLIEPSRTLRSSRYLSRECVLSYMRFHPFLCP